MNLWRNFSIVALLIFILVPIGACNSGESNLLEPGISSDTGLAAQSGSKAHTLLGYYSVVIDLANKTVDTIPLREVEFHLNVLPFLEPPPLTNLTIGWGGLVIDPENGLVKTDVIITHPFLGMNEFIGFDVKGIVITDGSLDGFTDVGITIPNPAEPRLANADGFTRWWNPNEFLSKGIYGYNDGLLGAPDSYANYHSTLNGYKYFADGLQANDDVIDLNFGLRGRFSAGNTNRRHFIIDFGDEPSNFLIFNYAVDASWYQPDKVPPTGLDDFPSSANQVEAFAIVVDEELNTLYHNPTTHDCGGTLGLQIDVFDWQKIGTVGSVRIEAPNVFDGAVYCTPDPANDPDSIQGTYYVSIEGQPQPIGEKNNFLICVEDINGTYEQDGMTNFNGPNDLLTTAYYVHTADVSSNSPPNVGPVFGPVEVIAGTHYAYSVDVTDFEDNLNDLTFAWEIGDDVPPAYDDGPGYGDGTIDINFQDNGSFLVDVKVTDTAGGWATSEQPLSVNVSLPGAPPNVGNVELSVVRDSFNIIDTLSISWGIVPGAWQYVIYYTDDPYTPGEFIELDTTPFYQTTYIIDPLNKNNAYLFTVRARTIPDNPDTESGDSQYAYAEFETAEDADPYPWTAGSRVGPGYTDHFDRVVGAGAQAGQKGWRMDVVNTRIENGAWSVIASPPIPVFSDVEIYRIEFLRRHPNAFNYHGLSVGTTDVIHDSSSSTFPRFDVSTHWIEGDDFWGTNNAGIRDRFEEVGSESWAWWDYAASYSVHDSAFELPRLGELIGSGSDAMAAFGYGGAVTYRTARVELDEIVVIVY